MAQHQFGFEDTTAKGLAMVNAGDVTAYAHTRLAMLRDQRRGLDFLSIATPEELGLDASVTHRSSPSGDRYLGRVLDDLRIRDTDTILDIGCGKGSAMRLFLRYPFVSVDGLEISDMLVAIARRNFAILGDPRAHVHAADAVTFPCYGDYEFLYLYNPFPESVLIEVFEAVTAQRQRETVVVYANPVGHNALIDKGFSRWGVYPDRWGNGIAVYTSVALPDSRLSLS